MAISGVGTEFYRWNYDAVPAAYEKVAEVFNISGPSMSKDVIDTTTFDNTGGYRSFISGFKNSGTLVVSLNYDSKYKDPLNNETWYERFKNDFELQATNAYKLVLPDGSWMEIEALVTEMPLTISADDKIVLEITLQVSGIINYYLS